MNDPDPKELDAVLTLQLAVAWAGESSDEDAPRLGWWSSDMCTEFGGQAVLEKLAPRTAGWAAYELAREAARRVDERTRTQDKNADRLRSLFHLGHPFDELLADRLREFKASEVRPESALPRLAELPETWDPEAFKIWLGVGSAPETKGETAGLRITTPPPSSLAEQANALAAANFTSLESYPCAHFVDDAAG